MREVYGRFTRSELGIMGWRSRETAHNMSSSMRKRQSQNSHHKGPSIEEWAYDTAVSELERRMGGVANKALTDDGDIDLGKLTGPEALQFLGALGVRMGGRA